MVNSIVIICEDSPFGKNSVIESIRMATGILAVGDIEDCKVILTGDAVYFLSNKLAPEVLQMDPVSNILRLMDLSDLEVYAHDESLADAGINITDLIDYDNIHIASTGEISSLIMNAEMTFKYWGDDFYVSR